MRSIALIGMLIISTLSAGVCSEENILSLYQEALESSSAFLAAQAGTQAEMEKENIARSQLLPSLGFTGNYGYNNTERQTGTTASQDFRYESHSYALNFRQPLFRKYNYALYQQSQAEGEAASAKFNQTYNELIIRLSSAYFEALFSNDQLALLAAQNAAIANQLAAAEKGLIAGSGTRIDIDEARARYDFIQAQELEAENQRRHNLRVLGSYVNRKLDTLRPLNISGFNPTPPNPPNIDSWLSLAEANNAELLALFAQIRAAEQEVEKALAGHYPTIDLVASTGRSANDSLSNLSKQGDTTYKTNSYGVQLSMPIFNGGQVSATARQARAKLEQTRMQAEETRRNIHVQTRREYDNVVQGLARIRALERAEASAVQMVKSNEKGIGAGIRSTLDVLLSEQQLYVTRRDLAQARYSLLIANLKLKSLTGSLREGDVIEINKLLVVSK